jgi:hypothetical protein
MITHANYHASVSQVVSCLEHRPSLGEATLLAMPLFHAGGMQVLTRVSSRIELRLLCSLRR